MKTYDCIRPTYMTEKIRVFIHFLFLQIDKCSIYVYLLLSYLFVITDLFVIFSKKVTVEFSC